MAPRTPRGTRLHLTAGPGVLASLAMEPQVTERDVALLLLSEDSLVALGAVLGWQARAALDGRDDDESFANAMLPA